MMKTAKWYGLALFILLLDQLTKLIAVAELHYAQPVAVFPGFNLTLLYNTGAAFSFLAQAGGWQRWFFIILSLIVSVVIIGWIARLRDSNKLLSFGLALVLGGALGNVYDRVALGHVVDFIQLYYKNWYWPAFNIADSAICVGAALLIIDSFKKGDSPHGDHSKG